MSGACPMCGQPYESYFEHLRECAAGETEKPPVASTAEDPEWSTLGGEEE